MKVRTNGEGAAASVPERVTVITQDGEIAGWRWRREGAPRLVFCHATGFCASAYKRMLSLAARELDILAIDMRGHGRTRLPADPGRLKNWRVYADDICAVVDRLASEAPGEVILAGHSFGAVSAVLAAEGRPDIAGVGLLDPVAIPARLARLAGTPIWPLLSSKMPLVRAARARRATWPNRASVIASYQRKPLFASWAPGVLEDYLEDGLQVADGDIRLACAPDWEAATFAAHAHDFWGAFKTVGARAAVLAAEQGSTVRPFAEARMRRAGAAFERLSGTGHLLPMEKPAPVADFLAAFAKAVSGVGPKSRITGLSNPGPPEDAATGA
jgi:pimeloyl-ACP methyl ester carboxylesterase